MEETMRLTDKQSEALAIDDVSSGLRLLDGNVDLIYSTPFVTELRALLEQNQDAIEKIHKQANSVKTRTLVKSVFPEISPEPETDPELNPTQDGPKLDAPSVSQDDRRRADFRAALLQRKALAAGN
jgi:hypothetical protein